jgi:hypothetical protein
MLFPEWEGVKCAVVFFVKYKDFQYQFKLFNNNVVLEMFDILLLLNKLSLSLFNQRLDREYK